MLGNTESTDKLNRLNTSIPNCTETSELDLCLSDLSSVIEHTASPIFKKLSNNPKEAQPIFTNNIFSENPWFDEKCVEKKHYFLRMLDKYRESKNDI